MVQLIDELEFGPEQLENGLIAWDTNGKKYRKGFFFDGHKREDVVEYREKFLDEMKVLSSYFVEFDKDGSIVPKEYLETAQ